MKITNLCIILLFFSAKLHAQTIDQVGYYPCVGCNQHYFNNDAANTNFTYNAYVACGASNVSSDYDMRIAGGASRWHRGIDYTTGGGNADKGDAIAAIQNGTIVKIVSGSANSGHAGFKYMVVQGIYNLGYAHIFTSRIPTSTGVKSGDFVMVPLLSPNNHNFAIIDLHNCIAYSDIPNAIISYPNTICSQQTFTTTNQVVATAPIAPIGTSYGSTEEGQTDAHLHLYRFVDPQASPITSESNCRDPWEVISLPNATTTYNLMYRNSNSTNWNTLNFRYDQQGWNNFIIRAEMAAANYYGVNTYSNVAMNLDKVELFIKSEYVSQYSFIAGQKYESKIYLGAKYNTPFYPASDVGANIYRYYGGDGTAIYNGSVLPQQMGMIPYAYRDDVGSAPYDDFCFADIRMRIHKDHVMGTTMKYADLPSGARYNDGRYKIRIRSFNVLGTATNVTVPEYITLDNFQPYIKEVKVSLNGISTYKGTWAPNEGSLTVADDGRISFTQSSSSEGTSGNLQILVYSSEPLTNLGLTINGGAATNGIQSASNPLLWTFTYPSFGSNNASCYNMTFTGTDKSGNSLLDLKAMYPNASNNWSTGELNIPRRTALTGPTKWSIGSSFGQDIIHRFCLKPCPQYAAAKSSSSSACLEPSGVSVSTHLPSGSINLSVTGGEEPYSYLWSNMPVYPSYVGTPISANQNLTGMTPGVYCYEVSDANCCTVSGCVELKACPIINIGLIPLASCPGQTGQIQLLDFFMPPTVHSYLWSNGSTAHDLTGLAPGNYCVTVTDQATLCSTTQCATVTSLAITAAVTDACSVAVYGNIDLSVTGSVVPLSYYWSNGATTEDISNLAAGNYCVTVSDQLFCSITKCFEVKSQLANEVFIASTKNLLNCPTTCDGQIDIQVTGNLADYTYLWSTGATTQDISNRCPGTYTVTVTDNWGCKTVKQATLCCCNPGLVTSCTGSFPAPLLVTAGSITFPSVAAPTSGAININISGGTPPYYYTWSVPGGGFQYGIEDLTNIGATGQYCVTVTDGCQTSTKCTTISMCSSPTVTATTTPSCPSGSGTITTTVSGGVPPYTYSWNDGFTLPNRSNVAAGQYCVMVSSGSGSCNQQTTQCFNVGSAPISVTPNVANCTWIQHCGGQQIGSSPAAINYAFDDLDHCTELNGYCSITGILVSTSYVDLTSAYDDDDCRIRNFYCPNGTWDHSTTGEYTYTYYPGNCVIATNCPDGSDFVEEDGFGFPETNHFDFEDGDCFFSVAGCCIPILERIALETPPDPDVTDCFTPNWSTVEDALLNSVCEVGGDGCSECHLTLSCHSLSSNASEVMSSGCVPCSNEFCFSGLVSTDDLPIGTLLRFLVPKRKYVFIPAALTTETTLRDAKAYLKSMGDNPIPIKRIEINDLAVSKKQPSTAAKSISVYPNPFGNELNISYQSQTEQKIAVSLNDVTGRSMLQRSFELTTGSNTLMLNSFGNLPNGVYWLEITDDTGNKQIEKVVKLNRP